MELTQTQKIQFLERGYLVIPEAVSTVRVDAALRAINQSVGGGSGRWLSAWELLRLLVRRRTRKYCLELMQAPVMMDLVYQTPAWTIAESAIGRGKVRPVTVSQIPLRFPQIKAIPSRPVPHLDGMHSPTNGLPKGEVQTFTALVGILLSDLPTPNAGNFTVWPGTHRQYEQYFRKHSPESLLNGMPPIELPVPHQITGKAGDIVFCHYLLAHGVAPNLSPHIRYAVFFRLSHVQHESHRWESLTNLWLEWEGMHQLVEPRNVLTVA
jgi:hypothetical protein